MEQSLLEYPCDFPIKILGQTQAGFAQAVLEIVQRHAPDFDGGTVSMKTSKRGKYRASPASYATSRRTARRSLPGALRQSDGGDGVVNGGNGPFRQIIGAFPFPPAPVACPEILH